jgi:hypothetical protein
VIKEIRKMMSESAEELVSKRKMNDKIPARVAGMMQRRSGKVEELRDSSRRKCGI